MPRKFIKDKEPRGGKKERNKFASTRKKSCRFCADKTFKLDYKNPQQIGLYISERGKILPRRFTGACANHQRDISLAVKRARILAIIPFSSVQARGN